MISEKPKFHVPRRRLWLTPSHREQVLAAIKHLSLTSDTVCQTDIAVTIAGLPYGGWTMPEDPYIYHKVSTRLQETLTRMVRDGVIKSQQCGKKTLYSLNMS